MFRSLFGSSKKSKEEDVAEAVPHDQQNDFVIVDSGTNQSALYPSLNGGHLPYALLPAHMATLPANAATTNVNTDDSMKRDNFLDDVPFQLSPYFNNSRGDLDTLLFKSKSIVESKHHSKYNYSFDLERSVLRA